MKSKLIEFLTKLEELLAEYDAEISFQASDCSDWHGMSDERMEISVKDCEPIQFWYQTCITSSDVGAEI